MHTIRPGRRQVLTGLLAETAALLSGGSRTEAGKHKHKHKACPTCATCPAPTVCPPPVNTCPDRSCCTCAGIECRFGPPAADAAALAAVCSQVCGSNNFTVNTRSDVAAGISTGCTATNVCTRLRCPLI